MGGSRRTRSWRQKADPELAGPGLTEDAPLGSGGNVRPDAESEIYGRGSGRRIKEQIGSDLVDPEPQGAVSVHGDIESQKGMPAALYGLSLLPLTAEERKAKMKSPALPDE